MIIIITRVPGQKKQGPVFRVLRDGIQVHEEPIAGREDVQAAFLRAQSYCETAFQTKPTFQAGRDANKLLVWTTEPKTPTQPEVPKVSPGVLAASTKQSEEKVSGAFLNRATPADMSKKSKK